MPQPRTQEQLRKVVAAAVDNEDPTFLSSAELELLSVVPLTGEQLRRAARADSFADELHAGWLRAVNT